MGMLLIGLVAALISSVLYNAGVAFQAYEARQTPAEHALRLSLLADLVRRPYWLLGLACVILGWLLQGASLLAAPLTLVQPTLAAGLVVLLVAGARYLGERVGRREVAAVVAITIGVAGLTLAAPRGPQDPIDTPLLWLALALFASSVFSPFFFRPPTPHHAGLVVFSAGLAYAWCGLSTNLAADALSRSAVGPFVLWVASTAVAGALGLLSEMTALQTRAAIRVFPIVLVVQIVVAVLLAPTLGGESWSATPLAGIALLVALAIVTAGTALLGRSPAVAAVISTDSRA
jgi:drug/metabolite transporter (DMT)-like permease